jgi:2-polyprenyl-6-methoxyphenol hydroxylase-like FAD-dependent oxidoreductase
VGSDEEQKPDHTTCCIVGGGPAGAVLALLLARRGVPVTLLEAHIDFRREFRGNTINPAVVQIMEQIGLAERLLQLPHAKIPTFTIHTGDGPIDFADFRRLRTRYPYIMMLPQTHFLHLIVDEARQYPHFRLLMGARVESLIEQEGVVRGVRFRDSDGVHDLHATLVVGADGRFSRIRRLAGMEPIPSSPPMDVLWFNLPREPEDDRDAGAIFRFGNRSLVVLMDHYDCWQVGYIIAKGSYGRVRAAGLDALRHEIAELVPAFADRMACLEDWKQIALLSVESNRVPRWYKPGLLLIGDAAHVMSPVGGVGINAAIQDAVVAANVLATPLHRGTLRLRHLHAVQRQREGATRIIQFFQACMHRWGVASALHSSAPFSLPLPLRIGLRLPLVRPLTTWLMAWGAWPVSVKQ